MIELTNHLFSDEIQKEIFTFYNINNPVKLDGFCSYVYSVNDNYILKISHSSRVSENELNSELRFTTYISNKLEHICHPIDSEVKAFTDRTNGFFYCYRYKYVLGNSFDEVKKDENNLYKAGAILGKLHKLSSQISPHENIDRELFLDRDFVNYKKYIPKEEKHTHCLFDSLTYSLKDLPRSKKIFGITHGDAHDGNFLFKDIPYLIDFDDIEYGFYVNDFAVLLDSCVDLEDQRSEEDVFFVFKNLHKGYVSERILTEFELNIIPLFIKFRWLMQHTLSAYNSQNQTKLNEKQIFWRDKRIHLFMSNFYFYDYVLKFDFINASRNLN